MRVREQMTPTPVTAAPDDGLREAAASLRASRLHVLPVVEAGRLVGLLFARDLDGPAENTPAPNAARPFACVRDLMRAPTATVRPNAPIERAAALMLEHDVRGLPVVGPQHELLGVITVTDLLRTLVKAPPVVLWG